MQNSQLVAWVVCICFLCPISELGRTTGARAVEKNKLREKEIPNKWERWCCRWGGGHQPHPELQRTSLLLKECDLYVLTGLGPKPWVCVVPALLLPSGLREHKATHQQPFLVSSVELRVWTFAPEWRDSISAFEVALWLQLRGRFCRAFKNVRSSWVLICLSGFSF